LRPSRTPRSSPSPSPSPGCGHRELLRLRLRTRGALGDWPMREAWRRRRRCGGEREEEAEAGEHVAEVQNLEDAGIFPGWLRVHVGRFSNWNCLRQRSDDSSL
jgi:hypothetical protein